MSYWLMAGRGWNGLCNEKDAGRGGGEGCEIKGEKFCAATGWRQEGVGCQDSCHLHCLALLCIMRYARQASLQNILYPFE